jgi:threonine/homoserine/homoserine lactone efflux protein
MKGRRTMGLWITIITAFIGLELIVYGFRQKDRAAVKWILAAIGLVLILFAIWVATPQGTELISHLNWFKPKN